MVEKKFEWANGAVLEEHSKRKHKILREYFGEYMAVRCQLPQQERFRLAIVEGFAGGGRYKCGAPGSPIIFIEGIRSAIDSINLKRAVKGLGTIQIECLFIFNDVGPDAIEALKSNVAPLIADIKENDPNLYIKVEYLNLPFEVAYREIKEFISRGSYRNVLFNLDQAGHSHVEKSTLVDAMRSYPSAEIFYTFSIEALLSFLRKSNPDYLASQLNYIGLSAKNFQRLQGAMNRKSWLGVAERLVFEEFRSCAPFVSPFSINNPNGWRYWLIHFANFYRARQVYNNVLHDNSSAQAHFGRSGLHMLSYDPGHEEGSLYLFDVSGRETSKNELLEDIPRLVSESGDMVRVGEFYEGIYNMTPAHTDDIHSAVIENPDLEVITQAGGERRKANTIGVNDSIKLRRQKSFFPMFFNARKSN